MIASIRQFKPRDERAGLISLRATPASAPGFGKRRTNCRQTGATCDATGIRRADYLIAPSIFTATSPAAGTYLLKKVGIDMTVNQKPSIARLGYRVEDSIALRNGARS